MRRLPSVAQTGLRQGLCLALPLRVYSPLPEGWRMPHRLAPPTVHQPTCPHVRRPLRKRENEMAEKKAPLNPIWAAAKPFVNGGSSGMLATCIMQVQLVGGVSRDGH